jgi:hypothetical protein
VPAIFADGIESDDALSISEEVELSAEQQAAVSPAQQGRSSCG